VAVDPPHAVLFLFLDILNLICKKKKSDTSRSCVTDAHDKTAHAMYVYSESIISYYYESDQVIWIWARCIQVSQFIVSIVLPCDLKYESIWIGALNFVKFKIIWICIKLDCTYCGTEYCFLPCLNTLKQWPPAVALIAGNNKCNV